MVGVGSMILRYRQMHIEYVKIKSGGAVLPAACRGLFYCYGNVSVHLPACTGWSGTTGGVAHGGLLKLKNSLMSIANASRFVSGWRPKRVSINLRMAVESVTVCETKCFRVKGETIRLGMRKP